MRRRSVRSRSAEPVTPISPSEPEAIQTELGRIWLKRTRRNSLPELTRTHLVETKYQASSSTLSVSTNSSSPQIMRHHNAVNEIKQAIKEQIVVRSSLNSDRISGALSTSRNPVSSVDTPLLPILKSSPTTPLLNRLKTNAFNMDSQRDSSSDELQSDKIERVHPVEAESPPKSMKLPPIEVPMIRNLSALSHRPRVSPLQRKRHGNLPTLSIRRTAQMHWSHKELFPNSSETVWT